MAAANFTPTLLLSVLLLLLSRTLAAPHTLFPRSRFCDNVPAHKAGAPLHRRSLLRSNIDLIDSLPPSDLLPLIHLLPRHPASPSSSSPEPQPPVCASTASHNCPDSHLWCAYDSSTWILTTFTLSSPVLPAAVQNILARALAQILDHIKHASDGPVQGGLYGYVQAPTGGGPDYSTLQFPPLPAGTDPSRQAYQQPSVPQGLTLTTSNENNHQLTWGVLGAAVQALLNLMWQQQWWGAASAVVFDGENEVGLVILSVGVPASSQIDSLGSSGSGTAGGAGSAGQGGSGSPVGNR